MHGKWKGRYMKLIKDLNIFQKGILLVLVAMIIVFGVVYAFTSPKVGFLYLDAFLELTEEAGNEVYSGTLGKQECSFIVTPERTITYQRGEKTYGPYIVKEDPTAVPDEYEYMTGVEILNGNEVIFRGGYYENGGDKNNLVLIDENGDLAGLTVSIVTSDGNTYDSSGNMIAYGGPSATAILHLWLEPELISKANWAYWFGGILFSILTAVSMLFADDLFRLKFAFHIQNVEQVEPSELEIAGRYFGWIALTVLVFVINMTGLQ